LFVYFLLEIPKSWSELIHAFNTSTHKVFLFLLFVFVLFHFLI